MLSETQNFDRFCEIAGSDLYSDLSLEGNGSRMRCV
jgi:hypothetical protein